MVEVDGTVATSDMITQQGRAHDRLTIVAIWATPGLCAFSHLLAAAPVVRAKPFRPFTMDHAIALFAFGGAMVVFIMLGRAWRGDRRAWLGGLTREFSLRVAWCIGIVIFQMFSVMWWLKPAHFNVIESLPLHICDVIVFLAPVALLTERRWARAMVYFMGLGLSAHGFITPVVEEGPADMRYWLFWVSHAQIVGSALYDVVVRGFRPGVRDFVTVAVVGVAYVVVITPLNLALDTTYGYVGRTLPGAPTLIDYLGPWPWRVLVMIAMGNVLFVGMWLAWPSARRELRDRWTARASADPEP